MRILLIGNFIPPYEEENLHNITLLNLLRQEGHECRVMNIDDTSQSQLPGASQTKDVVFVKNYLDFIVKFFRVGLKTDVIHFMTKGYVRPGLMKMVTAVFLGKILLKKVVITLHPELFSIFGQMRSRMGGQQLLNLSFSLADGIICGDKHTYETASLHYNNKSKFTIVPSFFQIPENSENLDLETVGTGSRKKIIVFSGVQLPSLIRDILNVLLQEYLDPETGVVVSATDSDTDNLQNGLNENFKDTVELISSADARKLATAYANAHLVVQTLSCDCRSLFHDIAVIVKKPQYSANFIFFPDSLVFIKEGKSVDLIAYSIHMLLKNRSEKFPPKQQDYYETIKNIYLK